MVRIHVSIVCETRSRDRCNSFKIVPLPKEMCDEIRKYVWAEADKQDWQVDWLNHEHDLCPVCKELQP